MKIIVVYVFPVFGDQYLEMAVRFLSTYHEFPAGYPHESLVVLNGGNPPEEIKFMFDSMENCRFLHHDNSGYDCGAFQHAAQENDCDLMVFFGASAYLKGPGWLARVAESFARRGQGLYGVMGNRGMIAMGVHPHIRTTGFWLPPKLFREYPMKVTDPGQRYPFEHGPQCLTSWIKKKGLIPWVVSWSGEWKWEQWDSFPNGFHRGDQSDMIAGDKLSRPPYYSCP